MEIELKSRDDQHIPRRLWHLIGVILVLVIYRHLPEGMAIYVAALCTVTFVGVDVLRLRFSGLNKLIIKIFTPIMRHSEVNHPAGTSFLFAGIFLLVLFFPPKVITLSLIFLAVADPTASYFGIRFGKHKVLGRKSLEGSLAAFAMCFFASLVFFHREGMFAENLLFIALFSGVVGSLAELIPIGKLDDNFSLPILSAIGLSLVFWLFGGI